MSTTSPDSERALILTPLGRDAALTAEALAQVGITSCICPDVTALRCAMVEGAGVAVITQEVLAADNRAALVETLSQQPIWSDFPFVVFGPRQPPHDGIHLDPLGHLGNVTLLERPVRRQIMLSAVQAALRSRRRQYEARRAIEQRDQFLAMLGHELRNPLTAILLSAQLIERTAGVDPRLERHHAVIGRQARQLHRLVDDLLDVARVTTGKVGLKRERINLGELVRHSVQSLVGDNQAGPLVSLRIADEEVWVSGDPVRLEQIFSNLLSNALKYTPASKNIEVSLESTGGEAIVRIKDEGIGVAAEMLPRIFDLFTQADTALDRARGGMGVGLTLVKALVELHQGGIAAFSEGVGRGAEFVVRLPLSDDAAEIAVTQSLSIPASARHVLLIDDNDDLRETLRQVLESAGHRTEFAADGRDGLAMLLSGRPEIALIDIGLPGIDGYEIARRARAELGSTIRLIALSGYGLPEDKRRARDAGFDEHLTKPVDIETLQRMMHAP